MRRRFLAQLAAGMLGLTATAAGAATDCSDPQDQTTLNLCAAEAFHAADGDLNRSYKEIVRRLAEDPEALALLRSSERAWVAFRDAECAFQSSGVEGGSIQPMILAGCMESLTRDRVAALRVYLDCEEGDLSCPVPAAD